MTNALTSVAIIPVNIAEIRQSSGSGDWNDIVTTIFLPNPVKGKLMLPSRWKIGLADNSQWKVRHKVERQYEQFENRHTGIVNGIEPLDRQVKPFTMKPMHPIMGHDEKYKPPKQYKPIDYRAPCKHAASYF